MSDVKVRVGAAIDIDTRTVFRPLIEAARQARKQVERELQGIAIDLPKTVSRGAKDSGDKLKELPRITGQSVDEIKRQFDELRKNIGKNLDMSQVAREAERELSRLESAAQRSALGMRGGTRGGGGGMDGGSMPYRMGYWSMRNFAPVTPMLSMARRIAGDVAMGAGVDFNVSSRISDYMSREQLATQISNSAWIPTAKGAANKQVDPSVLLAKARETAVAHGLDQTDILGGLSAFVGKTGDLDTAMKSLDSMATLSKATGSSLEDMLDAAAAVSNALGEGADKSKVLDSVMRAIAGQGQVGAIEIRDMASNMEKLAAFSNDVVLDESTKKTLAGAGITDKTAGTVAVFGALAQAARAKGGRRTAQMATQAAFSFMRDLTSKHEMEALQAAGINVFADKEKTKSRDPKAIILDVLNYTRGDQAKLTKLIPNENSRSVFRAFAATYNETKGTNKEKLAAVSSALDDYLKVTMSAEEVQKKHDKAMDTGASKAAVFNAKLQEIADQSAERLLPTLEKLAPKILEAVDAFAKLVNWAAENPMEAVVAAFAAAVAKAGIEQVLRTGIERAFAGQLLGGGGAAAAGGGAGLGGAGAGTAATGIGAVGAIAVGGAVLADMGAQRDKEDAEAQMAALAAPGEQHAARLAQAFKEGRASKEQVANEIRNAQALLGDEELYNTDAGQRKLEAASGFLNSSQLQGLLTAAGQQDMKDSSQTLKLIHNTLTNGIKVKVDAPPGGGAGGGRFPQVDVNNPAGHHP